MKPTRVLWVGDAVTPTGFARVTHGILDRLHLGGFHVSALGLAYEGGPHKYPYPIWKADQSGENATEKERDPFGLKTLALAVKQMKPDVVVLFHDPWVVIDWLRILQNLSPNDRPKVITYSPVDGEGQLPITISYIGDHADQVCVYTEFGAEQFRQAGFDKDLQVIPHGVDFSTFTKFDQTGARYLTGIPQKKWVVLNANRNQPRKRIDLTIKGFVKFAALVEGLDPVPVLHLHMLPLDAGWDVVSLMRRECMAAGIDMMNHFSMTNFQRMPLSDADLNAVYNAADIGINTSLGEGWGLPAFEMAALGVPQVLTDYAASAELFKGKAWMLPVVQRLSAPKTCIEGGLTHEDKVAETLLDAYNNPAKSKAFAEKALKMVRDDKYQWESVARQFQGIIMKLTGPVG